MTTEVHIKTANATDDLLNGIPAPVPTEEEIQSLMDRIAELPPAIGKVEITRSPWKTLSTPPTP